MVLDFNLSVGEWAWSTSVILFQLIVCHQPCSCMGIIEKGVANYRWCHEIHIMQISLNRTVQLGS